MGVWQEQAFECNMQKSKSPAVARRILPKKWRKPKALPKRTSGWTSEGNCRWSNSAGRLVTLTQINMVHLSDVERLVLQKIALARVQAMDLGCPIIIPKEALAKRKRSGFSLKRRPASGSNLVGLLDNLKSMTENIKTKAASRETVRGKVFGVSLTKCINNDKEIRRRRTSLLKERRESLDLAQVPHRFRKSSSSSVSYGLTLAVTPLLLPPLIPPSRPQSMWVPSKCQSQSTSSVISLSDDSLESAGGAFSSDSLTDLDPKDSGGNLLEALSLTTSTHRLETVWKEKHNSLQANQPHVPYVVDSCLKHIETYGLHTLGIFRKGSSKKRTKQLREEFDSGNDVKLSDEHNPHEVAALLKEYFRDLPDPLLTRDLYNAYIATRKLANLDQRLLAYQYLIALLPTANRDTFWLLIRFLNLVSQHSKDTVDHTGQLLEGNKMDSHNLATLFGPNILHKAKGGIEKDYKVENSERVEESREIIHIVKEMIENYIRIFTLTSDLHDEVMKILKENNPESVDVLLKRKSTVSLEISADPASTCDESDGSLPRSPGAMSLPEGGLPRSFTEGMMLDMDQRRPQPSMRLHSTDPPIDAPPNDRVRSPEQGAWYLPDRSPSPRSPVLRPKQPRNSTPPIPTGDKSRLGVPQNLSDRSRSSSSEGRIGLPPSGLSRSSRKNIGSPLIMRKDNRLGVPAYSRESSMSSLGSYPNTPMSTSPSSLGPPSPRLSSVPSSPSSLCSRLNDHSDRETSPYRPLSNMSQRPLSMTRQRPVSMSSHSISAQDMQRDRWKKWERLAQESGEEFHEQETLV